MSDTFEANNVNFNAAVFMILFLTLNIFTAFLSVLIVDFERVNVGCELLLSNATHQLTQEDGCLSSTILVYCLKNSKQKYLNYRTALFSGYIIYQNNVFYITLIINSKTVMVFLKS